MAEDKKNIEQQRNTLLRRSIVPLIGAVLLLIVMVITSVYLFRNYSQSILDAQKNQLYSITESVGNNICVYLEGFSNEAKGLIYLDQFREAEEEANHGHNEKMTRFLEQVLEDRHDDIAYIDCYLPSFGYVGHAGTEQEYHISRVMGKDDSFEKISVVKGDDGEFYFAIGAFSDQDTCITLYISMRHIYEKTSSYIQMGEKGYVMIKASDGRILMHPVENQIGIDVLADRMEQYPEFDFTDLEVLIAHQMQRKSGVETYYSYWWGDEHPQMVKKVSAYMPVSLGQDFLIVSAVMNYSEITGRIQNETVRIMAIMGIMLLLFLLLVIFLISNLRQYLETARENQRLKEINENLEILRKEEEQVAHQQRLQLIGTMTGGIAHEFNNLLTPIMGYSAMILAGMPEDDENYEDIREIYNTAEKAKEIIGQITQFSARNAEKMMQPIHVSEAVRKALVIADAAKPRKVKMITSLETENDIIMGNPTQIQQMVVNLCNNALQAIGKTAGTLTVVGEVILPDRKKNAFFRGKEKQHFYQITVKDDGCGMDEETINQIFTPFFTTKRPGEGTGLGLSVVQRMVEAHAGLICVHSTRGEGAEFIIYLPILENADTAETDPYR